MNLKRMLVWTTRLLDTTNDNEVTDLVQLIDFDIEIALEMPEIAVNDVVFNEALRGVVTDWMNESFQSKSLSQGLIGNQTTFQTVALSPKQKSVRGRSRHRDLQSQEQDDPVLVLATFTGVSLWERQGQGTSAIEPELVELIQRATFLEDNRLLTKLQAADVDDGLGLYVIEARAKINPAVSINPNLQENDESANLEIIIIIAIVVACLAFALLMFAVMWAWRTDRQKQQAYAINAPKVLRPPDNGTGSTSDDYELNQPPNSSSPNNQHGGEHQLPSVIQPQEYPESVISEDISQSLTAYYKAGMAGYNMPRRELNDAASMSSMDSYGYSLDGYAPSLSGGPTQMGYPVGPMNGQIKDPNDTDADLEDTTDTDTQGTPAPVSRQEETTIGDKV